jgi:hypothetical protein
MATDTTAAIITAAERGNVAHIVTQVSSASAVVFGLSLNDIGAIAGMIMAAIGLVVTWYYRHKEYELKKQQYLRGQPLVDEDKGDGA